MSRNDGRGAIGAPDAIARVAGAGRGGADTPSALEDICSSVRSSFGFDRAAVLKIGGDAVETVAASGVGAATALDLAPPSLLREAAATRTIALGTGLRRRRFWRRSSASTTVGVVPLVFDGHTFGFLVVDRSGRVFDVDRGRRAALSALGAVVAARVEAALELGAARDETNRAMDFVALAAHELRNPAAVVCGIAATLHARAEGLDEDQRGKLTANLDEQGERLRRLINQLLDLSRLEARAIKIKPETVDIRSRTEDVLRALPARAGGSIEVAIDSGLRARVDVEAFDRIVSNLVTNALRYGAAPISVSATQNDHHFRLLVEDRGAGVPSSFAPRLFDRFARATGPMHETSPGSGLGLSIAQGYAHAHGGDLLYKPAEPHGAVFELVVPTLLRAGAAPA